MKTKINLTIKSKLIPRSKEYAKKKGKSVSQLVEELLERALKQDETKFSERWLGKIKVSDKKDERLDYLKKRYNL
ncbi:MAG: DUF6364 family protein [Melioribacteraceae bacterium]|nr:DUF6364 family protein [Melioribacteraceae bacterium]